MLTNGSAVPCTSRTRAGDPRQPRRDIDHGRPDGLQVPRRLAEVQQQLTSIVGEQLPGTAALHGEEQRPSGSGSGHWGGDEGKQPGQGTSTQQYRRWWASHGRRGRP